MEEARAVRRNELDPTLALVNRVFRTGVDQDMSTDYPLVFDPGNLETSGWWPKAATSSAMRPWRGGN